MSDGFDDLDDELLGLGGGDDASDASEGHHSDSESKPATKQTSAGALSGDESEGAISDSTIGSESRKKKPTTVVTSPSPRRAIGGDDEDDGEVGGGVGAGKGVRKRPSPGEDESSPPKKRAKGPAVARKGKKRRGSDDEDEDEDEGAFSDAPSSAVISEASSDDEMADSPADLYPYDGIYKSATEKAEVEKLNQLQREQFIADRKEEVDRYRENEQMVNRARLQKLAAAKKKKKRAADDDDYDDSLHASAGARRSTRGDSSAKKTADSKKNASLTALRQKRNEKSARKAGADVDRPNKKRRDSISEGEDEGSDNDHDDKEAEWAASQEKKPSATARKGSEESTFDDIKLLMVTRNTITKFWTYPNFETATTDCFVRISIGNHPDSGKLVYRLCQIKGWQDSKSIYEVSSGDRTIKYRRNAIIATGSAEKPTRVDVISDSPPTEDEWRWYIGAMEVAKLKRPDFAFVERKRKDVKDVTTHQLTNDDFDAMRRMRTSYYPEDPILPNLDLPSLKRRRQQLVDEGDESEILRIDRELEWRAPPRALTAALSRPTQLDVLGQINKRNREINRQDIRKAQIEEKKRNEIAARMAAENGDSSFMDPFARVKTHAKIYHNEKPKDKDGDMEDLFGDDNDKEKEKQKNGGGAGLGKTDSKVPQVKVPQHKGIDAAIASMDLQFDIDFSDI
ncbi:hypothetical protein TWF281_007586 [Arthrobotrys megalospora]